jgi:hypothetical protein
MAWILRWKEDENKQNKLIGLAVLALISFLSIFMLLASPRPRPVS